MEERINLPFVNIRELIQLFFKNELDMIFIIENSQRFICRLLNQFPKEIRKDK